MGSTNKTLKRASVIFNDVLSLGLDNFLAHALHVRSMYKKSRRGGGPKTILY